MVKEKPLILLLVKLYMLPDQERRLHALGDVRTIPRDQVDKHESDDLFRGAKVVCGKRSFLTSERLHDLHDMMIAIPFGKNDRLDPLDRELLAERRIRVVHIARENKESVAEWIVFMMLALSRGLHQRLRTTETDMSKNLVVGISLNGKRVTILGKGTIGAHLGPICESLGMRVSYYLRGDDLPGSARDADFIVNCLGHSPGATPVLDRAFFSSLKRGCYFISVASPTTYDIGALLDALRTGALAGVADDVADVHIGDSTAPLYRELLAHDGVLVTPHIAWRTDYEARASYDKLLDCLSEYLAHEGASDEDRTTKDG